MALLKDSALQERHSKREDPGNEGGAAVEAQENEMENVVVNIVRQSVSPLSHATPHSAKAMPQKQSASGDYDTSHHFCGSISTPLSVDKGWRGSLLPDDRTDNLPDKGNQSLEQENFDGGFRHGLNSPAASINSREEFLDDVSSKNIRLQADTGLSEHIPEVIPQDFIHSASSTTRLSFDQDASTVDTFHRADETQHFSSPGDSDSFDWRDEESPIVQARYKSKRRSSAFFAHQRPSRLLETPSPVEDSLEESPEGPSNWNNENSTQHQLTSLEENSVETDHLEELMTAKDFRLPLPPGFQPIATPDLGGDETDESVDESESADCLLEPIYEDLEDSQTTKNFPGSAMVGLETNYRRLQLENKRLRERLQSKARTYDFQIGPFRHAFETVSFFYRRHALVTFDYILTPSFVVS